MIRRIAVVTGTRSEYGIIKPLIQRLEQSENHELLLIVTGLHLLKEYGLTINEISHDGFRITSKVNMYDDLDGTGYHGIALGKGIIGFTDVLSQITPDFLLVFGDRLEPLAAVLSAATLNIPIGHIHGGDRTDSGHIDEKIRSTISQFSHLHFTAHKEHTERLIHMGEELWRIHEVGALGLDSIISMNFLNRDELSNFLEIKLPKEYAVCLFHPVSTQVERAGLHMMEILSALRELSIRTIIIYPNNDKGSSDIIQVIEKESDQSLFYSFRNIPHNCFISLLNSSSFLIGNSSCGIIESPLLKLPVINVGIRNTGRCHANNVFFVEPNKKNIIKTIKSLKIANQIYNPYGYGKASEKIFEILNAISVNDKFMNKRWMY